MRNKRISKRAQSVDEYSSKTKTQKLPTILTPTFGDWKITDKQEHPKISKRNPIYEKFYPPSELRDLRSEGKENQKRHKSTGRTQEQDVMKYESADKIQDENRKPIYHNINLNYRKRINIGTPQYQSPVSKGIYFKYTEQDVEMEQLRGQLAKMEEDQRLEQEYLV